MRRTVREVCGRGQARYNDLGFMVIIDDEEEVAAPPVERRIEPRGVFPGLSARILSGPGAGVVYEVLEASRIGFFLRMATPDLLPLGERLRIELSFDGESMAVEGIVLRKEIDPRCGMAVGITEITPEAEQTYRRILGIEDLSTR